MELLLKEELDEVIEEVEQKEFIEKKYDFPYKQYVAVMRDRGRSANYVVCLGCGEKKRSEGYFSDYNLKGLPDCDCARSNTLFCSFVNYDQQVASAIHVSKVKYNKKYFETTIQNIRFTFDYNEKIMFYEKTSERVVSEVTVKFEILEYRAKQNKMGGFIETKNYNSDGTFYTDRYTLTKNNFNEAFNYYYNNDLVDFKENIIKLGLAPYRKTSAMVSDNLWLIYTNYRRFNFLIENNIGVLEADNLEEKARNIEFIKNKPFYFKIVSEKIEKRRKDILEEEFDSLGYDGYHVYMSWILNEYPTEDPRYYEVYKLICEIEDDDKYYFGYQKKDLALLFVKCGYTDEEIDAYIEACLRQSYKIQNTHLKDTKKVLDIANIPIVKIPKEMHVFYNKMDFLERFAGRGDQYKEIIKKAFNMKNGQDILDKFIYLIHKKGCAPRITKRNKVLIFQNYDFVTYYNKELKEISVEEAKKLAGKELK
jgi:hypothetical protein